MQHKKVSIKPLISEEIFKIARHKTFKNEKYGYGFLIDNNTYQKIKDYHQSLISNQKKAGSNLQLCLKETKKNIGELTTKEFLKCLINSKEIFCAMERYCSDADDRFTDDEISLLSGISLSAAIEIYGKGIRSLENNSHKEPFDGYMHFVNGALLKNKSPDYSKIVPSNSIDKTQFDAFYHDRLLAVLTLINKSAEASGTKAVVSMVGLGCGAFAGAFNKIEEDFFYPMLFKLLEENKFDHIAAVQIQSFDGLKIKDNKNQNNKKQKIGDAEVIKNIEGVQILEYKNFPGLLQMPQQFHKSNYQLHKITAWDPLSMPGNEIALGHWNKGDSDDPAAAADSNILGIVAGVGDNTGYTNDAFYVYNKKDIQETWENVYQKDIKETWENVYQQPNNKLNISNNTFVTNKFIVEDNITIYDGEKLININDIEKSESVYKAPDGQLNNNSAVQIQSSNGLKINNIAKSESVDEASDGELNNNLMLIPKNQDKKKIGNATSEQENNIKVGKEKRWWITQFLIDWLGWIYAKCKNACCSSRSENPSENDSNIKHAQIEKKKQNTNKNSLLKA